MTTLRLLGLVLLMIIGAWCCAGGGGPTAAGTARLRAEAGVQAALARLDARGGSLDPGLAAATAFPGWGLYLVTREGASADDAGGMGTATDGLDNDGDGAVDEPGERWPEVVLSRDALGGATWVRLSFARNDSAGPALRYGKPDSNEPPAVNTTSGWPVVEIAALGESRDRRETVVVRATRPPFPLPAAPLITISDRVSFGSVFFLVSGLDWDPADNTVLPSASVPGILTAGSPDSIIARLNSQQRNNVEGTSGYPSVFRLQPVPDLDALAAAFAGRADRTVNPGELYGLPWGTLDAPEIVHVAGSFLPDAPVTGAGILVVDGDLALSSGFRWTGAILVRGGANLVGSGYGAHVFGTVAVARPNALITVGGNTDLKHASRALDALAVFDPYTVLSGLPD
jgi:hypothetical protein